MSKIVISISGTPGTGKSTLAKLLQKKLGFARLDLHQYCKDISTEYNHAKKCYDVDLKRFKKLVQTKMKAHDKLVIDSHISHILPKKWIDLCIVLVCSDLKKLKRRLENRKYSAAKVRENVDAEIFQICLVEAEEKGHNILVIDTAKKLDEKKTIRMIQHSLHLQE